MKTKKNAICALLTMLICFLPLLYALGCTHNPPVQEPQITAKELFDQYSCGVVEVRAGQSLTKSGSGVIIEAEGQKVKIVTNYHVVKEALDESEPVKIRFFDTYDYVYAKKVGFLSEYDICILEADYNSETKIHVFELGEQGSTGEQILAIGYTGSQAVAFDGIISTNEKLINYRSSSIDLYNINIYVTLTTASYIEGCSGGAVINNKGELIGMASYILTTYSGANTFHSGLSYAIPAPVIKAAYKRITEMQSSIISGFTINNDFSVTVSYPGCKFDFMFKKEGLIITRVESGDFTVGQRITKVNGVNVEKSITPVLCEMIKTYSNTVFEVE